MPRLSSFCAAFVAALIALPTPAQVPEPDAVAGAVAPVAKTNVTTDVTDLWWPDAEPGWGIQLVQNRAVVFATLYVYGPTGSPTFYVATLENPPGGTTGVWTGTLYATTGPWFGGAFNPAAVIETAVGTMTFALTGIGIGTLEYTVGATSVSKTVNRQPLRFEDNAGTYALRAHLGADRHRLHGGGRLRDRRGAADRRHADRHHRCGYGRHRAPVEARRRSRSARRRCSTRNSAGSASTRARSRVRRPGATAR